MREILKNYKQKFEAVLKEKLCYLAGSEEPIKEAVEYAVTSGGKRIRPILVYLGAKFMNCSDDSVDDLAVGMECIHNYSLVHDDLPCMDNDTLRHGKACTHIKFGEGIGVLAGDALLNLAFELMLKSHRICEVNYVKAISYISKQSGIHGMIGGQCIDIKDADRRSQSLQEVVKLNLLKTSCLFKASLVGGAIANGANNSEIKDLEDFCEILGLIFQIVDDILDVTSTKEELGKNIGSDIDCGKITYLSIVGIEKSKEDIITLETQAKSILLKYGDRANSLVQLCEYLTKRTY